MQSTPQKWIGRPFPVLKFWSDRFPEGKPADCVFPAERYGISGNARETHAYATDASEAIRSWKEAWETVKTKTVVSCRFHDLRHTAVTRMLEAGMDGTSIRPHRTRRAETGSRISRSPAEPVNDAAELTPEIPVVVNSSISVN
jgi:hypothetical protein